MKKYIILFFFFSQSLSSLSTVHSLWARSIYYINGEKRKELSWRKTVVIDSEKVIQPPSPARVKEKLDGRLSIFVSNHYN